MADIKKQIMNLKNQNDGMETSFKNKGIQFTKLSIDENIDTETELSLLKYHNEYLKGISKNNRPPPQTKEVKTPLLNNKNEQVSLKNDKHNESDDEDELTKEDKLTFATICNMEDAKRAFFSKEYETFMSLIQQQLTNNKLRFYKANYKWSDDNMGKPDFVARNLLRGFVQTLDSYRKYLMVCFRCILVDTETKKYSYPSYWIINTDVDIKTLLGSLYDDYDFIVVEEPGDIDKILTKMKKNEDEKDLALVGETYLH
jgi:hypothetical protein